MMRKLLTLICIFSGIALSVSAQDSTHFKSVHSVGIYSGYSKHVIRDDIISPLKYKGSTLPIGLTYTLRKAKTLHQVVIQYDNADLKSSISDSQFSPYTHNINAFIGYSYNRKILTCPKLNADFYLGARLLSEISYREHYYNSHFNEISGEQITSLGINLLIRKKFLNNRDIIDLQLSIPVLAYSVFNNRYNAVVGEAIEDFDKDKNNFYQLIRNGEFITLNNFQEFQSTIGYTKFLNENIGLSFRYYLSYYKIVQHEDTSYARHLNSQINVGLIFNWSRK